MNYTDSKIIDYLTVQIMSDKTLECNPHIRVRTAWILAKKKFLKLSGKEKEKIRLEMKELGILKKFEGLNE
jgi:hypothetical protein